MTAMYTHDKMQMKAHTHTYTPCTTNPLPNPGCPPQNEIASYSTVYNVINVLSLQRGNPSTTLQKISFSVALVIFGLMVVLMAYSGILIQLVLKFPLFLIIISGMVIYGIAYLFDFIFLNRKRLNNLLYFLTSMAIWIAIAIGVFMSFIPPLKMNAERIIFRPTDNCNMFENPTNYICSIMGQKFYTTIVRGCDGSVTNATAFYIISPWMRAKNQYQLNKKVHFHPDNDTDELKSPYWLRKGYCIQEYKEEGSVPRDGQIRVGFYSWNKSKRMASIGDTGYINREDLEEYNTGWYEVSNCMWEISRLLPLENYCITGYVSSVFVTLPDYMAMLLYSNEIN